MDSIKAASHQSGRVTPSQSGAKERDEGFVASRNDVSRGNADDVKASAVAQKPESSQSNDVTDRRSNALVEQRKQELAKKASKQDGTQEQTERLEQLSAQRQLESRAAANKQKIKNSYDAVQQGNNQQHAEANRAAQSETTNTHQKSKPEPINLVV